MHGYQQILARLNISGPAIHTKCIFGLAMIAVLLGLEFRALASPPETPRKVESHRTFRKRINFIAIKGNRTPNPAEWETYDGLPYNRQRGYGWEKGLKGIFNQPKHSSSVR
jgi:hypothetical protein